VQLEIREFRRDDASGLLALMRGLAEFEDYADEFAVTEGDLLIRGLSDDSEFTGLIAETDDKQLVGMAVYYPIPYTHDLRPDFVLKELFVADEHRSTGVGQALMKRLVEIAKQQGCTRIKWLVLRNNHRAKKFYQALGAAHDEKWEPWLLKVT